MAATETLADRLQSAFQKHQAGELDESERVYREILAVEPDHLDACQLLGALLIQNDKPSEAIPYLRQAIAQCPHASQFHVNLGTAYSRCRQLEAAVDCYQAAIRLDPTSFDAKRNLGSVLLKLRRYSEAVAPLREAVNMRPRSVDALTNLGVAVLKAGQWQDSVPIFESALRLAPHHRQALAGLGQALLNDPQPKERVLQCWEELLRLEPENPALHNNLATVLKNAKQFIEAEQACRRALELAPAYFPALCNLGVVLAAQDRFEEARECLIAALARSPDKKEAESDDAGDSLFPTGEQMWTEFAPIALLQLTVVENTLGNSAAARASIERALAMSPDNSDIHMMNGFLHLERGEFGPGWDEYEWRRRGKLPMRQLPGKEWSGEPLPGGTVLLHVEQGFGDTLHFVRYARLVRERVGRVVLLSQKALVPLMQSCLDVDQVVGEGEPLPPYDAQLPLLSAPRVLGTTLATVPRDVPYLWADATRVARWQRRLADVPGLRVGICWQGNREYAFDRHRSVPLHWFRPLATIPGVRLISLQKGDGTEQLAEVDFDVLSYPDIDAGGGAFLDTAAIMKNLDLVISSDTAVPHLAGAVGVPVWLATARLSEWRWLRDREDCPWYPTMRLFRQPSQGDWESVFGRMRQELEMLVAARPPANLSSLVPVELAPGELLDKLTILDIKRERMTDPVQLGRVQFEHAQLQAKVAKHLQMTSELTDWIARLRQANEQLWDIEDALRTCERQQQFDQRFIELARSVYFTNDRRAEIKKKINLLLGSAIVEEKSYVEYQRPPASVRDS